MKNLKNSIKAERWKDFSITAIKEGKTKFEDAYEETVRFVLDVKRDTGRLFPFIVLGKDTCRIMLMLNFQNDRTKEEETSKIRYILEDESFGYYVLATEIWIAKGPDAWRAIVENPNLHVRDLEEKEEGVLVCGVQRSGESVFRLFDSGGKELDLPNGMVEGTMANLFTPSHRYH